MPKVSTRKTYTTGVSFPSSTPSPSLLNMPQPPPQVSQPSGPTPIVPPSPSSQNNDGPRNNNEQSDQSPPMSETSSSLDKRKLITICNKSFYPKEAFEMLKMIVHSHFDGPYSTWKSVDPKVNEFWWNKWKEKFDSLVEQASQDTDSNGPNSIDTTSLWITAVGGPKKDSIFGMGSEAHAMIQETKGVAQDITTKSRQNLKDELRAEFMAVFSSIRSDFGEKVHQVESSLGEKVQQVESSLGSKVQQVENCLGEKVKQLESSLQQVESTIGDKVDRMHKRIDNLVDKDTLLETLTKVLKNHLPSSS